MLRFVDIKHDCIVLNNTWLLKADYQNTQHTVFTQKLVDIYNKILEKSSTIISQTGFHIKEKHHSKVTLYKTYFNGKRYK